MDTFVVLIFFIFLPTFLKWIETVVIRNKREVISKKSEEDEYKEQDDDIVKITHWKATMS